MKARLIISSIIIVLIVAVLLPSNTPQLHNTSEVITRFDNGFPTLTAKGILLGETTTLIERMEHYYVPGVSIAIINDHEIAWAKGYGVLDADGGQPVTPETLFPPASIGKALTAVAALHYVEMGLLDLDQNVNDLLTSWKIPENEYTAQEDVTLRRLLSHTAGVSISGFKGYLQGEELPTLIQILDGEPPASNPPVRVDAIPGTGWRYSGGGYQILEQLLIDVTGESFPAIMDEAILEPLGMTSTTYAVKIPEELKTNTAAAHGRWGQPVIGKWLNEPYMGAGALWSTPTDLARFANEIMLSLSGQSNLILSKDTTNLMVAPQVEDVPFMGPLSMDWGLGWQLNRISGEQLVSHGGDIPEGYQNLLVMIPERGWGAVIFTNGANGDALRMEILYRLAVLYGIFPSLTRIAWLGYLLLLLVSLLLVWLSTSLIRRARRRKSHSLGNKVEAETARGWLNPTVITTAAVSILYYAILAVGLGSISGPPRLSSAQSEALGKIEQGEMLAEHGMIEEALAYFSQVQQDDPDLEIPASAWNQLCIRGSVWGYHAEVRDACELAVSLAPDDDGMLFGRGLSRALANDFAGAIEDFTIYVEWTQDGGFYDPYGMEVEGFISELEAGKNPFDDAQLDQWK